MLTIAVVAAVGAWWTFTAWAALRPAAQVHGRAALSVRTSGITAGGLTGGANLAAGDSVERQLGITNVGTKPVAAAAVVVGATGSPLDSGLTVHVDRCSIPWFALAGGHGLTCRGAQSSLTGAFAPGSRQISLALAGLKPKATAWLRVTVKLAAAASAAQQGVQTTLTYTFSAS